MTDTAENIRNRPVYRPVADIYETEAALHLVLEVPGVAPADLHVSIEKRVLNIAARSHISAPEGFSLVAAEFRSGDYERSFTLAETIDVDGIEAGLRDGVLHLTLPKSRPAPAKTISVKAG